MVKKIFVVGAGIEPASNIFSCTYLYYVSFLLIDSDDDPLVGIIDLDHRDCCVVD